jgi:uncharacterized protein
LEDLGEILLVGFIILTTHCLEGITGFGCTVLALPFLAMLLGLKTAVPVLVVLAWILAGYIILRSWQHIIWKNFGFIVLFVGLGLPGGILMFDYCPEIALMAILSIFMVSVGLHGIYKTYRNRDLQENKKEINDFELDTVAVPATAPQTPNRQSWLIKGVLFLGGIIHGAFGTGGPFVVIYATKALRDKTLFRVTLCLLWFSLNSILLLKWSIAGNVWDRPTLTCILTTMPFLIGGMLLGDWLHHKVNEYYFRLTVYVVLALSGIVMGISNLNKMLT